MRDFDGHVPGSDLVKLPDIGHNTAGAIAAYSYNRPVIFIETNIRTVFVCYFFATEQRVVGKAIADLVAAILPDDIRRWYWALMDYFTYLKQTVGNVSRQSKHCARQSAFEGSRRQIRGQVLKLLGAEPHSASNLAQLIADVRSPPMVVWDPSSAAKGIRAKSALR